MALRLATLCSPLVHEAVDWRPEGLRAVLLGLQALQEALHRLDAVWRQPTAVRSQDQLAEVSGYTGITYWWSAETTAFSQPV